MNNVYLNVTQPFEQLYMPLMEDILRQLHPWPNNRIEHDMILDTQFGTDRTVYTPIGDKYRYAIRCRKYEYLNKYSDEFTIRNTELPKIRQNVVDYMLYGFVNPTVSKILKLHVIDIFNFNWDYHEYLGKEIQNNNTDNYFIVFNINDFKKAVKTYDFN